MLSQAFYSDLCWRQTITSFPQQLQSERFLPHSILNPPNLLREKLILFLALHSLCAPKLSPQFALPALWSGGGVLQLNSGWLTSQQSLIKKKPNEVNIIIKTDTLAVLAAAFDWHNLLSASTL